MGRNKLLLLAIAAILAMPAMAQSKGGGSPVYAATALQSTAQTLRGVCSYPTDSCFTVTDIPDSIWTLMQGRTYRPNPYIQRSDLQYIRLLHYDLNGEIKTGEMVCNKSIAQKVADIFRRLYEAHYPIGQVRLPDEYEADDELQMEANNTSCFCYRNVEGSKNLSKHALGMAIDINTLYNPCVRLRNGRIASIAPENGMPYTDRSASFPCKIDRNDLAYRLFTEAGFRWGGDWRTLKDYQHFEMP